MDIKEIKLTKATEGERKAYSRGFKAGVEMCLDKINDVMEIANFNFTFTEMGGVLDTRGEE